MAESQIGWPMLKLRTPLILNPPDEAWFDIGLMHKDIRLARQAGAENGTPLPTAGVADEILTKAEQLGYTHRDIAAVHDLLAHLTDRRRCHIVRSPRPTVGCHRVRRMPTFVLRLIAPRPNFAQTMTDSERAIMNSHAAHWRPYLERGDMVVFGPVLTDEDSYGLAVVETDDEQALREFAAQDPVVITGTAAFELGGCRGSYSWALTRVIASATGGGIRRRRG